MMFQLFEAIVDRMRDQAADYASAQARIGARTLAHLVDPFGATSSLVESPPVPASATGTDLHPPRPRSGRRARSNSHPTTKRPPRQSQRLTSPFA